MDFDDLLTRYFGEVDPGSIAAGALEAGLERIRVDFGLEKDRGRRFALWALMYMLGGSPDLDVAFREHADREAARNFMDLVDRAPTLSSESASSLDELDHLEVKAFPAALF